jgi:hypothetical protein
MIRRTVACSVGALLLVGLGAGSARAGSITINMTTRTELTDKELTVNLTVGNTGDEAAGSVVPILRLRDREVKGAREDSLPPGGKIERTLVVPVDDLGEGRWPFRVAVSYTDQNQYPFQALHVSLVTRGNPLPAKVAVTKVDITPLESNATMTIRVKNLAGVERTATVTVFGPEDIDVQDGASEVKLAPWAEDSIERELTNRTALTGSRYPLFAIVEYDEPGTHHAVVSQGIVEVSTPRAFLPRALLWLVGVLLLGWVALLAWRWRGRKPAAASH